MTNVFGTPEKASMKSKLFEIGVKSLEGAGYKVERVPRIGKSSVRRISKGTVSRLATIRTTQDTWIAFPRLDDDKSWRTLDDVDVVVAVSVDNRDAPRFAKVHLIEGDEMRARFNRAYQARKQAGHTIPIGRGVWVALYIPEASDPVTHVGAGIGLLVPPLATVSLDADAKGSPADDPIARAPVEAPLSIAEAKRRLAETFGVGPEKIRIIVEA